MSVAEKIRVVCSYNKLPGPRAIMASSVSISLRFWQKTRFSGDFGRNAKFSIQLIEIQGIGATIGRGPGDLHSPKECFEHTDTDLIIFSAIEGAAAISRVLTIFQQGCSVDLRTQGGLSLLQNPVPENIQINPTNHLHTVPDILIARENFIT